MNRYFFAVLLLAANDRAGGLQSLKTGYISKDLNYLPFFIAQKKGFHAKEGIPVDLVSIGRSDIQLQALVAGELHSPTSTPITSSFGTNGRAAT